MRLRDTCLIPAIYYQQLNQPARLRFLSYEYSLAKYQQSYEGRSVGVSCKMDTKIIEN